MIRVNHPARVLITGPSVQRVNIPQWAKYVYILAVGGGGGGAGGAGGDESVTRNGGGGGGAAGHHSIFVPVSALPYRTLYCVAGQGGNGGSGGTAGSAGGNSYVLAYAPLTTAALDTCLGSILSAEGGSAGNIPAAGVSRGARNLGFTNSFISTTNNVVITNTAGAGGGSAKNIDLGAIARLNTGGAGGGWKDTTTANASGSVQNTTNYIDKGKALGGAAGNAGNAATPGDPGFFNPITLQSIGGGGGGSRLNTHGPGASGGAGGFGGSGGGGGGAGSAGGAGGPGGHGYILILFY